jgi:hypothetical protein
LLREARTGRSIAATKGHINSEFLSSQGLLFGLAGVVHRALTSLLFKVRLVGEEH